jgi:hypothetical protein
MSFGKCEEYVDVVWISLQKVLFRGGFHEAQELSEHLDGTSGPALRPKERTERQDEPQANPLSALWF